MTEHVMPLETARSPQAANRPLCVLKKASSVNLNIANILQARLKPETGRLEYYCELVDTPSTWVPAKLMASHQALVENFNERDRTDRDKRKRQLSETSHTSSSASNLLVLASPPASPAPGQSTLKQEPQDVVSEFMRPDIQGARLKPETGRLEYYFKPIRSSKYVWVTAKKLESKHTALIENYNAKNQRQKRVAQARNYPTDEYVTTGEVKRRKTIAACSSMERGLTLGDNKGEKADKRKDKAVFAHTKTGAQAMKTIIYLSSVAKAKHNVQAREMAQKRRKPAKLLLKPKPEAVFEQSQTVPAIKIKIPTVSSLSKSSDLKLASVRSTSSVKSTASAKSTASVKSTTSAKSTASAKSAAAMALASSQEPRELSPSQESTKSGKSTSSDKVKRNQMAIYSKPLSKRLQAEQPKRVATVPPRSQGPATGTVCQRCCARCSGSLAQERDFSPPPPGYPNVMPRNKPGMALAATRLIHPSAIANPALSYAHNLPMANADPPSAAMSENDPHLVSQWVRNTLIPPSPTHVSEAILTDSLVESYTGPDPAARVATAEEARKSGRREQTPRFNEIVVRKCVKHTQIWLFTSTKMKNALTPRVLRELTEALRLAKTDDSRVILLSGCGNFFCTGIDAHFLLEAADPRAAAEEWAGEVKRLVNELVTYPKPIVCAVNGPAVGFGVGLALLCDVVFASDKAHFYLPYARLGSTPEACITATLPAAVGLPMASEMLLAGRKLTALEAFQTGLVSQVFWPTSLMQEVVGRVEMMAQNSGRAMEASKILMRGGNQLQLQLANESECRLAQCRLALPEVLQSLRNFAEHDTDWIS